MSNYSKSYTKDNKPGPAYTLWEEFLETNEDSCIGDFYCEENLDLVLKGLELLGHTIDWSRPWADNND